MPRSKSSTTFIATTFIALLRGINVGRAKRISMADLRELVESIGGTQVRTLLNSGNVVFVAKTSSSAALAGKIESALEKRHGFSAATVVISADELNAIVESNPLVERAPDASRHLVAFVMSPDALMKARPLLRTDWTPDALAIGPAAAYLWCATGILDSKMLQAFARALTNTATTRNWATVMKLHALVNAEAVAKKG